MSYARAGDMAARFGAGELKGFDAGAVASALADAAAEIDAALAVRFALPLPTDAAAIAVRAGWSSDGTIEAVELEAFSTGDTVTIPPLATAHAAYLAVWRSDLAGGEPCEIDFPGGGGNARNLFGPASPLEDANGQAGQVVVSAVPQRALLGGEKLVVG